MIKRILKKIIISIITLEAKLVLKKYKPKIIAITGSVGKTTVKDAVCEILGKHFFVECSPKSFNSEIGVPLTILGSQSGWSSAVIWAKIIFEGLALIFLKNHYPNFLVLEIGTDRPGDIKKITSWLKPDIVIVTRLSEIPVHIEFFKNKDDIIKEKGNLVSAMKEGGKLILNADDEDVLNMQERTQFASVTTFGFGDNADIKASNITISYDKNGLPNGVRCRIEYKGRMFPLRLFGVLGRQHVSVAIAALAVGVLNGINEVQIVETLSAFVFPRGRGNVLAGINNSIIIDDSYNASPVAVEAGLKVLQEINARGKKIAVLGDMLELGKHSIDAHRKIGSYAAKVTDILVAFGPRSEQIWEVAITEKMNTSTARHFNDYKEVAQFLKNNISEGDIILVKGSQSMRMEKIVAEILLDPQKRKELLVRQEPEWLL